VSGQGRSGAGRRAAESCSDLLMAGCARPR